MSLKNTKSNIQLFISRRCQLRCCYCPVLKGGADMPRETAVKAVDFLMGHRSRNLRMDFGGGEPLLNFDVVKEAADYGLREARKRGKSLSFYMVTNAIALDQDKLDWIAERDFVIELSMDGDRGTHNRFKLSHEKGLDPYSATRRGVELALKSKVKSFVIAVASPSNARRLPENFEHLLDMGARNLDLSYALGAPWSAEDEELFFSQVERIALKHKKAIAKGEIRLGNLAHRVEPAILNSELMVDTDGKLHLLSEWMFETTRPQRPAPYSLGSVHDGLDINDVYWNRFHCYYTLVKMHQDNVKIRKVLLNNIAFGGRAEKFFSGLREKIYG